MSTLILPGSRRVSKILLGEVQLSNGLKNFYDTFFPFMYSSFHAAEKLLLIEKYTPRYLNVLVTLTSRLPYSYFSLK